MEERKFLVRADEVAGEASGFSHPWNPNSQISGTHLSTMVGLSRTGVSWSASPPERSHSSNTLTTGRRSGST